MEHLTLPAVVADVANDRDLYAEVVEAQTARDVFNWHRRSLCGFSCVVKKRHREMIAALGAAQASNVVVTDGIALDPNLERETAAVASDLTVHAGKFNVVAHPALLTCSVFLVSLVKPRSEVKLWSPSAPLMMTKSKEPCSSVAPYEASISGAMAFAIFMRSSTGRSMMRRARFQHSAVSVSAPFSPGQLQNAIASPQM